MSDDPPVTLDGAPDARLDEIIANSGPPMLLRQALEEKSKRLAHAEALKAERDTANHQALLDAAERGPRKTLWDRIGMHVSIGSGVCGIIGLIVAVRSCQISEKALAASATPPPASAPESSPPASASTLQKVQSARVLSGARSGPR